MVGSGGLGSRGQGMGGGGSVDGLGGLGNKGMGRGTSGYGSGGGSYGKKGRSVKKAYKSKSAMAESPSDMRSDSIHPNVPLESFGIEAGNYYRPQSYSSPHLPVAQANGVAYTYQVQGVFEIPSTGQRQQIPIDSFKMVSTPFYETTPALEEMAYLKATLQHKGELPILKGNTNIFLNGKFNTQGVLKTTLQDGNLEVPLGADENIRIKRNITPKQRTEGFLMAQDITDYEIQIDVGNYKNKPITIRVIDQVPKTNNEKIVIGDILSSHDFTQKPNADGILYWEITIPAQETEQITLNYSITRPKDWILWGN